MPIHPAALRAFLMLAPRGVHLCNCCNGVLSDLLVAFEDNVGGEARLPEPGDPQAVRTDMSLKGFVAVFVTAVGVDANLKMVPIAHFQVSINAWRVSGRPLRPTASRSAAGT